MIRLPPSSITLGPSDLQDFEKSLSHRKAREAVENVHQDFDRYEIGAEDGPSFGRPPKSTAQGKTTSSSRHFDLASLSRTLQSTTLATPSRPPNSPSDVEEIDSLPWTGVVTSPENVTVEIYEPSSPAKEDDFHYGGFVESPSDTPVRSSIFSPDDASTPPIPNIQSRSLPRSPLYLSQNASSSSPNSSLTISLTPRVVSRTITHSTPGLLFAQPARRPRFRHQTNSFSLDSSETTSAVYEQHECMSSTSLGPLQGTNDIGETNLQEELLHSQCSEEMETLAGDGCRSSSREFIFSSPELPPPFSTTPRISSGAETLPSQERQSPYRAPSLLSSSDHPIPGVSRGRIRPAHLATLADTYSQDETGTLDPQTPSRTYQVYNDLRSPATQPQTPAHLPEARHQSRYHPSYTAPVTRGAVTRAEMGSMNSEDGASGDRRRFAIVTPSRRAAARSGSPIGLLEDGFRGLYAGRENGDEEQNWNDGRSARSYVQANMRSWRGRD